MMPLQVLQHLGGDVDRLEPSGSGVVDIAGLGQYLENGRSEALLCGFIPDGHLWITAPALVQVILPAFTGKRFTEYPVMLPDNQIQKISQEGAVLDGRSQDGMGGHFPGAIPDEPPKIGFHGLQAAPNEPGKPFGGFSCTYLKYGHEGADRR